MRFVLAIFGMLIGTPPLLFFWIGSQTFVRPRERQLAIMVTCETAALIALSAALLFTPSVEPIQIVVLIVTIATLGAVWIVARRGK
jgi:hypothetical protein